MVGLGRLELPTLRLSGVRSNHLSYRPAIARADLVLSFGLVALLRAYALRRAVLLALWAAKLVELVGIEPATS